MKKIILIIALLFAFSISTGAEGYSEQLEQSNIDELPLDSNIEEFFDSQNISIYDSDWVNKLSAGNLFTFLFDTLKENGKTPVLTGLSILGIILLLAVFRLFFENEKNSNMLSFVGVSLSAGAVLLPIFSVITGAARTLKSGAQFMLSFIPIYSTVLYASGKPVTSAASGSILLAASEALMWLASYVITPILSAYLAVSLCTNVSPAVNMTGVSEFMKKCVCWALGLVMTIYMGILSVQSTVNSSADSLALKTGKFMVGSFVPVVGGAVSEALGTVESCMGLLRSSVGIYGIVVLALMLLPTIAELLLWRAVLLLVSSAGTVFECPKITAVLKAADSAVAFLLGILLICAIAFIVSLTVITAAGG